jgi:N-acyl-phosphatidylethanolamine-hydrolysing phospholipase D
VFPELDKPRKLKHIWEALTTNHGNEPTSAEEADMMLPIQQPDFSVVKDGMKATWLGHSTVLIQDGYTNILTDPVFSERASPISFMGPKRFRRPACLIT